MMNISCHCNRCNRCTINRHRYNGIQTFSMRCASIGSDGGADPPCHTQANIHIMCTIIANDETPSSSLQIMIKPIQPQPNLLLSFLIHIGDGGGNSTMLGTATQSATTSTSSMPSYELMKQRTPNKQRQEITIYTQSVAPLPRACRYMIHVCWVVIYAAAAAAIVRRGLVVIVRSGWIYNANVGIRTLRSHSIYI